MDRKRRGECFFVYKHRLRPEVDSYLKSQEYRRSNYGDELLYRVANSNLDRFIDFVGRATFNEALRRFRESKEKVEKQCPPSSETGPCDASGNYVPGKQRAQCYYADYGCGYKCADNLFDRGKIGALLENP